MADITDYISYAEVRAVLGVSDLEIDDATLALPLYFQQLQLEFADVSPDLQGQFDALLALPEPRDPEDQKLLNVMQVFSTYAVAKTLLASARLFAPRRITDGRATVDRFVDPFEALKLAVNASYADFRNRLLDLLGIPRTGSRVFFAAAGLAVNPVTG